MKLKIHHIRVIWCKLDWFIGERGVKVFKVTFALQGRLVGRGNLLVLQGVPVNGAEERVRLNVREARLGMAAQTLLLVLKHQS